MAPQNPSSCAVIVSPSPSGDFIVTWVGGNGPGLININVFESPTGGTPLSGYSVVGTINGLPFSPRTVTLSGYTPILGYYYAVVVHNDTAAGTDLSGPTISPAYQNVPPPVMPVFSITSIDKTKLDVTWSGGGSVVSIGFKSQIALAIDMGGAVEFADDGTFMLGNSGTQSLFQTYPPGFAYSCICTVTFSNSTTQSSGVITPGLFLPGAGFVPPETLYYSYYLPKSKAPRSRFVSAGPVVGFIQSSPTGDPFDTFHGLYGGTLFTNTLPPQ